jgi:hypothetical protein
MTTTQTTNTSTPDLDIIVRIEKLLAKSEDKGATEAEREIFQAKAFELMERHRIDQALIGGHLKADDVISQQKLGDFNGTYGRVRIQVVAAVARAFDVEIFWKGYGAKRAVFGYGFASDIEQARVLSNRLLADCDLRAQLIRGWDQGDTMQQRRGFYLGYAQAIDVRFRKAYEVALKQAQDEGVDTASAALVLVDRKKQVNEEYRNKIKARPAGGLGGGSSTGHGQGYSAGSQADLSHGNSVGSRKAIGQ